MDLEDGGVGWTMESSGYEIHQHRSAAESIDQQEAKDQSGLEWKAMCGIRVGLGVEPETREQVNQFERFRDQRLGGRNEMESFGGVETVTMRRPVVGFLFRRVGEEAHASLAVEPIFTRLRAVTRRRAFSPGWANGHSVQSLSLVLVIKPSIFAHLIIQPAWWRSSPVMATAEGGSRGSDFDWRLLAMVELRWWLLRVNGQHRSAGGGRGAAGGGDDATNVTACFPPVVIAAVDAGLVTTESWVPAAMIR
nr:hypothetical protein Iba_chr14bCG7470 [Ipomoea batatas]